MHQNEINDKLKDLVDHDEEEEDVDDLLKDLEKEIKIDNKKKIEQKNPTVNVNVNTNTQALKAKKEQDDIARMLADI